MMDAQGPSASIFRQKQANFFNPLRNSVSNQNVHKILSSITFYGMLIAGFMQGPENSVTLKLLFIGQPF